MTISMRYHEILITFTRATRVPPSGVDFFNTLKEFTLLEETGKPQMLFLGSAKCIRTSGRYSHVTGCFFHRKVNAPRYEQDNKTQCVSNLRFTSPLRSKICMDVFFRIQLNAFTYITMLKTHCVTNLRASTQRCACCVLELLRSLYKIVETWEHIQFPKKSPNINKSGLLCFGSTALHQIIFSLKHPFTGSFRCYVCIPGGSNGDLYKVNCKRQGAVRGLNMSSAYWLRGHFFTVQHSKLNIEHPYMNFP